MRFLMVLALLWSSFAFADGDSGDWVLDSTRDGIVSYTRSVPGQQTLDFRAVVRVKVDFETAVTALADVEHYPDWFWHMKETKILRDKDLDDIYLYLHIDGITPVADRDVVVKAEMWQDPISLEMNMQGHSIDDANTPKKSGIVRIPDMTAGFRVTPVSPTITEIELSGSVDPGGAIPVWASNMLITVLPRFSLDNLRTKLAKDSYREYLRNGRDKDARWSRLFHDFRFTTTASN